MWHCMGAEKRVFGNRVTIRSGQLRLCPSKPISKGATAHSELRPISLPSLVMGLHPSTYSISLMSLLWFFLPLLHWNRTRRITLCHIAKPKNLTSVGCPRSAWQPRSGTMNLSLLLEFQVYTSEDERRAKCNVVLVPRCYTDGFDECLSKRNLHLVYKSQKKNCMT